MTKLRPSRSSARLVPSVAGFLTGADELDGTDPIDFEVTGAVGMGAADEVLEEEAVAGAVDDAPFVSSGVSTDLTTFLAGALGGGDDACAADSCSSAACIFANMWAMSSDCGACVPR